MARILVDSKEAELLLNMLKGHQSLIIGAIRKAASVGYTGN